MYFNYEMNRISILVHISSPFRGITLVKKRSRAQSENKHRPDRRRIIADSKDKFRGAVYVFTGPYVENLERGSLCVHHLSMVVGIQRSRTNEKEQQAERERERENRILAKRRHFRLLRSRGEKPARKGGSHDERL